MRFESKEWGIAYPLHEEDKFRIVLIKAEKGHQCSVHTHALQSNSFLVVSGLLVVVEEPGTRHERRTILGEHMQYCVAPGVPHCFQTLTRVIAIETYKASEGHTASADDIVRHLPGKRIRTDE